MKTRITRVLLTIAALAVSSVSTSTIAGAEELAVTLETPMTVAVPTTVQRTVREVTVRRLVVDLEAQTMTVHLRGAPAVVIGGDDYAEIRALLRGPLAGKLAKFIKRPEPAPAPAAPAPPAPAEPFAPTPEPTPEP